MPKTLLFIILYAQNTYIYVYSPSFIFEKILSDLSRI